MKLREWKYMNPQNSNTTSAASTSAKPSGGSTKRFQKLLDYHIAHKDKEVDKIIQKDISPYGFTYVEHYANGAGGYTKKVKALMNARGDWTFSVFINEKEIVLKKGKGWETFVHDISFDLNLPIFTTDPDYQDLLEWVDKSGKKVSLNNSSSSSASGSSSTSSGYKKRFEKLIKYHIDHASSELESITAKDIKDYSFHLGEHYNDGHDEFDREIIVAYDSNSDSFFIHIFVDGKEVESIQRADYEDFVKAIEPYMFLPDKGTVEYDDLLEWVDSTGKKVSQPSSMSSMPSASSKTNKEKFEELTKYMKAHVNQSVDKAEVVRLDDGGFTYKEHWLSSTGKTFVLTLLVGYSRFNSSWRYELYMDTSLIKELQGSGWEDLLEELEKYFHVPKAGSKEYSSLTESISFADEFKLYENLF